MATIDETFADFINSKETENNLDIDPKELIKLRIAIQNGLPVSTDTKIDFLFRSGWEQDLLDYTPGDSQLFFDMDKRRRLQRVIERQKAPKLIPRSLYTAGVKLVRQFHNS